MPISYDESRPRVGHAWLDNVSGPGEPLWCVTVYEHGRELFETSIEVEADASRLDVARAAKAQCPNLDEVRVIDGDGRTVLTYVSESEWSHNA